MSASIERTKETKASSVLKRSKRKTGKASKGGSLEPQSADDFFQIKLDERDPCGSVFVPFTLPDGRRCFAKSPSYKSAVEAIKKEFPEATLE